jgi:hypothetical protein
MEEYFDSLGMGILAPNCVAFSIITTGDSRYLADSKLKTKDEDVIPPTSADTTLRYLGRENITLDWTYRRQFGRGL